MMYLSYAVLAVATAALTVLPGTMRAAGRNVDYELSGVRLEGYLARPEPANGKAPAVVIFHDWNGIDNYEKSRADMLAKLGYVAFAADIYGKGVRPKDAQQSSQEASRFYRDADLLRSRARAGLDYAKALSGVDPARVAVIGYCFGGYAALELARSGADFPALVSFHGGLDASAPAREGQIKPELLILHGGADQAVTPDKVAQFVKEMIGAGARFELVVYPGAPHAFTVPGSAYREHADRASWSQMQEFLKRTLHSSR